MQVLDHGYVNYVEHWGSDEKIIEAARMSTAKGFQGWDSDARLLSYLWHHKHSTPFEFAGLVLEAQAPIFVVREWMRHRTFSFNEMSGRYVELPNLYYIPSIERLMSGKQSQVNKQGSEGGFSQHEATVYQNYIKKSTNDAREMYTNLLAYGMSRELARLVIPVNQYTRFRASANLRNWLAFLQLRLGEGVQWEMKQFAIAVASLVEVQFPRSYALFKESQNVKVGA